VVMRQHNIWCVRACVRACFLCEDVCRSGTHLQKESFNELPEDDMNKIETCWSVLMRSV